MPVNNTETNLEETTLDRAKRVRDYVEEMIALVSEHPECELKSTWRRDIPYLKAEFIKDFQSIANSSISANAEKYIAVGVNETTREIIGCNPSEYDEASIRQLLESYLDPVPEFEVLHLKSSKNLDFVVIRIPHQPNKPFIARSSIVDDKGKIYFAEGQIWVKPGGPNTGSTGKRLLRARAELLQLIDIETRVQMEVEARLNQLIPEIRLQERTRLQGGAFNSTLALTATDEEFESYVEQLIANNKQSELDILLEKLRDKTVYIWTYQPDPANRLTSENILEIKQTKFLPAIHQLVLLGLLIIKYSAPKELFIKIADLLLEVFDVSFALGRLVTQQVREQEPKSLDEHASHTVPALESQMAAYLLTGYELTNRNNTSYTSIFFPRIVKHRADPYEDSGKIFFMFWPFFYWAVDRYLDVLVLERYGKSDRIEFLLGGKEAIKRAVLETDCLMDWHSFMSFPKIDNMQAGEPETVAYFKTVFPDVSTQYHPTYIHSRLAYITPMVSKIWSAIHTGEQNYWLLAPGLPDAFGRIDVKKREELLARFLIYAQMEQARRMLQSSRIPYDVSWPNEIDTVIEEVRAMLKSKS